MQPWGGINRGIQKRLSHILGNGNVDKGITGRHQVGGRRKKRAWLNGIKDGGEKKKEQSHRSALSHTIL